MNQTEISTKIGMGIPMSNFLLNLQLEQQLKLKPLLPQRQQQQWHQRQHQVRIYYLYVMKKENIIPYLLLTKQHIEYLFTSATLTQPPSPFGALPFITTTCIHILWTLNTPTYLPII